MAYYTYLALGDSYTIGEGVALAGSFPYQAVQLLRKMGLAFCAPEIIATTGWTTSELSQAIDHTYTLKQYSIVSLLIGVNNQYRELPVEEYATEFKQLLHRAIAFAGGNKEAVFVLSIPDWGVTPFAAERDAAKIAVEIDRFNAAKAQICGLYKVNFIDITRQQRADGTHDDFLAADLLHPSAKEYAKWANQFSQAVAQVLKPTNGKF